MKLTNNGGTKAFDTLCFIKKFQNFLLSTIYSIYWNYIRILAFKMLLQKFMPPVNEIILILQQLESIPRQDILKKESKISHL
jgi:hypothetical protein